jgi:hypothetical protein
MAFADPQSVTVVGSTASTLPRTSSGTDAGGFTSPDGTVGLIVSHSYGKRTRRTIRVNVSKVAPDPFTGINTQFSMSAYVVVDVPVNGFTIAEQQTVVAGLATYLNASSGARITQLLGGEN